MAVQPCMEWIPIKKEKEKKQVPEKEKEKETWLLKKNNIRLSPLPFNCNIEKTKIMIYYVKFVSWAYISLVNVMYSWFILFANTCHNYELIRVKDWES